MNQGTKQIENITNDNIRKGYVKTKVGVFPADWKQVRFGDLFSRLQTKNKDGCDNVLTISAQYGLINQGDFFNKDIASEDKSNYFLLKKGDWAYNKSYSSGYPFGAIKRLDKYEKGIVSPLYICFADSKLPRCSNFYSHYFENGLMDKGIKAIAQEGARNHGLLNIGVQDFFNLPIMYPPIEEQEKIAEILDAQDRIIKLKEQLLEEKKLQKKYLMQQLLTGKKRLPGFSDEWNEIELRHIVTVITDTTKNLKYDIMSITAGIGFVKQSSKFGKEIAGEQYKKYTVIKKYDFSYNKGNSKKYPQGCIYPLDNIETAAVPNVFISFRMDKHICYYGYYKFLFEMGYLNRQLYKFINFGVRNDGLLNLNDKDFLSCTVLVPPIEEQQQISQVLFSINNQIELIQKSVEQEKQKKKALMQLLLTGIARVL